MELAKVIGLFILVIFLIILVLQNTDPVITKMLFFQFNTPRALLLFLTSAVGFLMGMLTTYVLFKRKK